MGDKSGEGEPQGTAGTPITIALQPYQLSAIDMWSAAQSDIPSRPEAFRRLIDKGLAY